MGRNPGCRPRPDDGFSRGAWSGGEDKILLDYIKARGEGRWSRVSRETGLKRCGKSCRLRWMNYLRPDIKRGNISADEEDLIIRLHKLLGNRWSLIAGRLPGRTDNEIKNYWNTNLAKKASQLQLTQFPTTSLKPQQGVVAQPVHPISFPVPQQATPTIHHKNTSNLEADHPNYNITPTQTIGYDSDSSGGSPLNSVDDLMNFNLQDDDISQILESDFPGMDHVYLEGLLSPEPELEIDDYLNMMVEEQGFRNRFSACLVSADAKVKNNGVGGEDCMISSDFGSVFESDQEEWPSIRIGENDVAK